MLNDNKLRTFLYFFAHTVLLQFVVDAAFVLVGYLAYFAAERNITIVFLIGAVAFIAMLILYVCIYVFHKSYGLAIFRNVGSEFNSDDYVGPEYQHVEYNVGRRNTFTGRRSVNVSTQTRQNSSIIIISFIYAIFIGLFGVVQFVIEILRCSSSEARAAAWDRAAVNMFDKMKGEGIFSFFKIPALCAVVIAVAAIISSPFILADHALYNANNVSITMSEMQFENGRNPYLTSTGNIESNTGKDVRSVKTVFVFRDGKNNVLAERDVSLHGFGDGALSKGESSEFYFTMYLDPNDPNHVKLAGCELDDLKISVIIQKINYGDGNSIELSEKERPVKQK